MTKFTKITAVTLALMSILSANVYAGNCQPTTLALETGVVAATRLPIKDTPIIWIDVDYTDDLSQCTGVVGIGSIYDNYPIQVTTVAPQ